MKEGERSLDIYKIVGKLVLEGKEQFDNDVNDAKQKGSNLASGIGKALGTVAKVGAAAVGAATTAIVAMTKTSMESYAEYEQLVGGSKLLFGDAYDYVAQKASEAYSTVQMSQNDYLQQVNGFATGLKTALGGDAQAAAELADRIITAEADIVAATGNSQEAVQNAFNGIMKSNFTMLDNLQIGITPTKEGFQEVIDKVNEWNKANGTATDYMIDNMADCQSALLDYIEMQGLSGYAQAEAAETIQGSISMVKASWQNLLTGLADEEADIDALINNLASSASTAARNIAPRVTKILNGISTMVTQMAPILTNAIPVIITDVLPGMIDGGTRLIQSLLLGISQNIDAVAAGAIDICMMLTTVLIDNLPLIVSTGMQLTVALITGIAQRFPELIPAIAEGIAMAWSALVASAPDFLNAGVLLIENVGQGLMNAFYALFPQVAPWVDQYLFQPIRSVFGVAVDLGREIIGNLWSGLCEFANTLFPGLGDLITGHTEDAVNASAETVLAASEKIPTDSETLVSAMAENMENDTSMETAAQNAVDRSATQMSDAVSSAGFDSAGADAMQKYIDGINSKEGAVLAAVSRIAAAAVQKMKEALDKIDSMASSVNPPGFSVGLDYVPYDEFPALLHKGEAVLTAAEASVWRAGKKSSEGTVSEPQQQTKSHSGITIVQNIQTVPQTPVEFAAATEAYFEQARWSMA
jgi:hypothetical protein